MAFMGPPINVADVVVRPSRSIIKQSYDARERRNDSSLPFHLGYGNLNGDGFGIGWFPPDSAATSDHTPCVRRRRHCPPATLPHLFGRPQQRVSSTGGALGPMRAVARPARSPTPSSYARACALTPRRSSPPSPRPGTTTT